MVVSSVVTTFDVATCVVPPGVDMTSCVVRSTVVDNCSVIVTIVDTRSSVEGSCSVVPAFSVVENLKVQEETCIYLIV